MNHRWNADRLLTQYFNTSIRFYLYGRILDLTNIYARDNRVRGIDSEGKWHRLHNNNILFAFPVKKIPDVEPHIDKVNQENIQEDRSCVDEGELESVLGDNVILFTRGGHVISGELQDFDEHHLFMCVGNTLLLVYRYGLFKCKKEMVPSQTKTNDLHELNKKREKQVEANHKNSNKEIIPSQTKTNDLNELRKKRKKWVEANRENNFEEGIKHLLTDLYPDNAHFIYELLQNAEDARASEVQFVLTNDSVEFEHNGYRLFSAEDVDAITSIGFSTKRDDPTKIGKFGIGFKAVFAYTATPEIESGEYHFQIRDMVVPDTEKLNPGALGERKTRFTFPFNNPKKHPDRAKAEITKNLQELNENTLLFLSNIRKIEYHLPDSSDSGFLERREREQDRNRIEISVKRPEDLAPNSTHYLRFEKVVSARDEEEGELKKCRIAVAFGMEKSEGRGWRIIPLNPGQVCIYFPAVKETSKLHFHIHAPFASTVARDSVRECRANTELLNHLADLITESMSAIRDQGLLNVEFLAVLPNDRDNLSADYLPIQKQLIEAFNNEKLTPMKRGGHAAASGSYRGSPQLSDLIQDGDLARLLRKDNSQPLWIANPQQRNQREDNFLSMLDISEWTTGHFTEMADTQPDLVLEWLQEKSDAWHQQLYVLLDNFLINRYPHVVRKRKHKLSRLSIVRCMTGDYRAGSDCHFFSDDIESDADLLHVATGIEEENKSPIKEDDEHQENFHYVAKEVYTSGQNKDQQEKARKFLETIGVCEVDEVERIKVVLEQRYTRGSMKPRPQDMKRFIALVEDDPDQRFLFKGYLIFEVDLERDNTKWFRKPSGVFIDSPYLSTGLTAYYETISENSEDFKRTLSPNYKKSGIDLEKLGKFAEKVGVQTKLEVKETTIPLDHPENPWLKRDEGNESNITRIDRDYIIPQFKKFLDYPSINKAELIWKTMTFLNEECLKASFQGNHKYHLRVGISSLVYDLRRAKWIPQKDGDSISFACPRDALREYLPPEGFAWPKGQPHDAGEEWLNVIEFGKIAREQKAEYLQQHQRAQEMGFSSGDEVETMVELANVLRAQGKSPEELIIQLKKQDSNSSKHRKVSITEEKIKPEFPNRSVVNPERWETIFNEELENAPDREYNRRGRSVRKVTEATGETRTWLKNNYTNDDEQMICQICKEEMPFKKRDGEYYFEAVEVFTQEYLTQDYGAAQFLALCPECGARYKEFVKRDKNAMVNLINQLANSNGFKVPLQLGELVTSLRFVDRHWRAIKQILTKLSEDT